MFALLLLPAIVRGAPRRAIPMQATAFSQATHLTSSGMISRRGIVAADPAVLPLGSRIRITGAGAYSGIYLVADTGGKVRGRHIDVFIPSTAAARRFGKRIVRVEVLGMGERSVDAAKTR